LLERRHLISGSSTTGFRTWEAALHLGTYLMTDTGAELVRNKNIIELGAGTGFVSLLCARHLRAKRTVATDGDEAVVEALKENAFLNGLDSESQYATSVLRWGRSLIGTWLEDINEESPLDLIVGADIVRRLPHQTLIKESHI
jgi:protein-lysine N-methyltransferase EEF2KMT